MSLEKHERLGVPVPGAAQHGAGHTQLPQMSSQPGPLLWIAAPQFPDSPLPYLPENHLRHLLIEMINLMLSSSHLTVVYLSCSQFDRLSIWTLGMDSWHAEGDLVSLVSHPHSSMSFRQNPFQQRNAEILRRHLLLLWVNP